VLIQIILAIIIGILCGTITGLIPGIHINLIGSFLIAFSGVLFYTISPLYLIIFIASMAITHTFLDFIPSILLGCPDTDTELSTLPGHELLKQGQGYQAILLTLYGSLAAIIILIIIAFPFGFLITKLYEPVRLILPYLLIFVSIMLIALEKRKAFKATIAFVLTGALGYLVLNLEVLSEPLLPMLTGLFGSSMLILSIKNKTKVPEQKLSKPKVKLFKPLLGSIISAPLCSFLPGLGSGQAAIIGNTLTNKKSDKKDFLVLLGATNTLVMGFSFITLYLFAKTRTGAAAAIKELAYSFSINLLILILIVVLISGIISFFLAKNLSKLFVKKIQKINYKKLSIGTLIFLSIIILFVSKFLGFLIFLLSTAIGLFCISLKVRRTNMMGCLLLPVIIFYLI
jgi:putative membrane protein